jgi:hypothetical protein
MGRVKLVANFLMLWLLYFSCSNTTHITSMTPMHDYLMNGANDFFESPHQVARFDMNKIFRKYLSVLDQVVVIFWIWNVQSNRGFFIRSQRAIKWGETCQSNYLI